MNEIIFHGEQMRRSDVLEQLTSHLEEIRQRFGVCTLALYGSYARDEAQPGSDVDLVVEFEGVPTFERYMGLIEFLEELLGTRVDVATPDTRKARIRDYVERDLMRGA